MGIQNCCAIILAAGRSERMGRPKQLLQHNGKSLLQHTIDEAKRSEVESVIVVLGYEADSILAETNTGGIDIVKNDRWQSGMASSITAAICALNDRGTDIDAVILMVCDQPFLDSALLNRMIEKHRETGKQIIACEYGGTNGVPVLFRKELFDQLGQLSGDSGAKKIINQNPDLAATVPFPMGNIDIDTPKAYQNLMKNVI